MRRTVAVKKEQVILLVRILLIAAFVVAWEMAARMKGGFTFYTSYPSEIFRDLVEFYRSGDLFRHMSITLKEALLGLFFGSIIGVSTGVLLSQFPTLGRILRPIISAINGIPQLTLAPVYILWFGTGIFSKIFLAGLMVFFNVFFSTYNAIKNIDQQLIETSTLLGADKSQILWHVVIPTTMPWIISGVRIGAGICMVGAIIGEYMGASGGFGWMVTYASAFFQIKRVMSCILILLIIGLLMNWAFDKLEKSLLRWRLETDLTMRQPVRK